MKNIVVNYEADEIVDSEIDPMIQDLLKQVATIKSSIQQLNNNKIRKAAEAFLSHPSLLKIKWLVFDPEEGDNALVYRAGLRDSLPWYHKDDHAFRIYKDCQINCMGLSLTTPARERPNRGLKSIRVRCDSGRGELQLSFPNKTIQDVFLEKFKLNVRRWEKK